MAQAPTNTEIKKTLTQSKLADESKKLRQKVQGKEFENNGQGVIPEKVWKNLPGKQNG